MLKVLTALCLYKTHLIECPKIKRFDVKLVLLFEIKIQPRHLIFWQYLHNNNNRKLQICHGR